MTSHHALQLARQLLRLPKTRRIVHVRWDGREWQPTSRGREGVHKRVDERLRFKGGHIKIETWPSKPLARYTMLHFNEPGNGSGLTLWAKTSAQASRMQQIADVLRRASTYHACRICELRGEL